MGAFRSALSHLGPLVEANPKEHELAGNLAECLPGHGQARFVDRDFPAALDASSALECDSGAFCASEPERAAVPSEPGRLLLEIGIVQARLEKPDESLAIHEKARAIQQALIDRYPGQPRVPQGPGRKLERDRFRAIHAARTTDAALKTFHEVQDICQGAHERSFDGPKPTWLLNLLALSQQNIGNIHKEKRELEKALPFFEEALKYRSDLADLHPSVIRFREKLGVSYREIAELEHEVHRDDKAIESIQRAIDMFTDLVRSQPENGNFSRRSGLELERPRHSS